MKEYFNLFFRVSVSNFVIWTHPTKNDVQNVTRFFFLIFKGFSAERSRFRTRSESLAILLLSLCDDSSEKSLKNKNIFQISNNATTI